MDERYPIEIEKRLRIKSLLELEAIADGYQAETWGEDGLRAAAVILRERMQTPRPAPRHADRRPEPTPDAFTRPRVHPFPGADWKTLAEELETALPFGLPVDPRRYLSFAEEVSRFSRRAPGGYIALAFAAACVLLAVSLPNMHLWPGLPLLVLLFAVGCIFGGAVNVVIQRRLLREAEDMGIL